MIIGMIFFTFDQKEEEVDDPMNEKRVCSLTMDPNQTKTTLK
jgi:hypothetical protein